MITKSDNLEYAPDMRTVMRMWVLILIPASGSYYGSAGRNLPCESLFISIIDVSALQLMRDPESSFEASADAKEDIR